MWPRRPAAPRRPRLVRPKRQPSAHLGRHAGAVVRLQLLAQRRQHRRRHGGGAATSAARGRSPRRSSPVPAAGRRCCCWSASGAAAALLPACWPPERWSLRQRRIHAEGESAAACPGRAGKRKGARVAASPLDAVTRCGGGRARPPLRPRAVSCQSDMTQRVSTGHCGAGRGQPGPVREPPPRRRVWRRAAVAVAVKLRLKPVPAEDLHCQPPQ